METPSETALGDLRVVDLGDSVASQFCGRLFADHGAQVILLEPPEGSAIRRAPPLYDRDGSSLLFWHLNTGKRSLVAETSAILAELAGWADVLIAGPSSDVDALCQAHPRLVGVTISDFGQDNEYSEWKACELVHQALSGVMNLTGVAGREPLYGFGHRASYAAGLTAYISALAALEVRACTGQGQLVEATLSEALAAMAPPENAAQFLYNGGCAERPNYPPALALLHCRDGWVAVFTMTTWAETCRALGADDLAEDPRFATYEARAERPEEWKAALQDRVRELAVDDVMARARTEKVNIGRVMTPADLWRCEHLRARGFWETARDADGRQRPILGPLFRMSATPRQVTRGAPELGEARLPLA